MIIPDHIPKYNQSVNYSVNLDCSPKDSWSIISTKSHLELFHPFCEKNPVIKWPGKGAIDELQYLNGWLFERNFLIKFRSILCFKNQIRKEGPKTKLR